MRLPYARMITQGSDNNTNSIPPINGDTLTKSTPRGYQTEIFERVMEKQENFLVYLPTGLGKTLVAAMVIQEVLRQNRGRQAFFVVETNALAMQQVGALQREIAASPPVQLLVGSNIDKACAMLKSGAEIIVATAGAPEHALTHHMLTPSAICCLVLDEAHHCDKQHPYHRVIKDIFKANYQNQGQKNIVNGQPAAPTAPRMKILALTASPAADLTVDRTEKKIRDLLKRLQATLVVPIETMGEVWARSPSVELDLMRVDPTADEQLLLDRLEILIVRRIAWFAPVASEASTAARKLLEKLHEAQAQADTWSGHWEERRRARQGMPHFPGKAHMSLLQRAFTRDMGASGLLWDLAGMDGGFQGYLQHEGLRGSYDTYEDSVAWDPDGLQPRWRWRMFEHLVLLLNLSLSLDEMGGIFTWRWLRDALSSTADPVVAGGLELDGEDGECLSSINDLLELGLGVASDEAEVEAGVAGVVDADSLDGEERLAAIERLLDLDGGRIESSKLRAVAGLLTEHRVRSELRGVPFSALVFVSTRRLAEVVPHMLMALPELQSFIRPTYMVGLEGMTLTEQQQKMQVFRCGEANVFISTVVCGEGIDIGRCGLVVCTNLPNSGTALVQLRGRIRCGKGCRFVVLSRSCSSDDQKHLHKLRLQEQNMFGAITHIVGREVGKEMGAGTGLGAVGTGMRAGAGTGAGARPAGGGSRTVVWTGNQQGEAAATAAAMGAATTDGRGAVKLMAAARNLCSGGVAPSPATEVRLLKQVLGAVSSRSTANGSVRSALNEAMQVLASQKVIFHGGKVFGPPHLPTFEATCRVEGFGGLLVAEGSGRGGSLKAAKEAAARHLMESLFADSP